MVTPHAELEEKLDSIDREIDKLVHERARYSKLLAHLRVSGSTERLTKKNKRKIELLAEIHSIVTGRRFSNSGATAKQLFEELSRTNKDLNYSTVRSYLTRFRADGQLEYHSQSGRWRVASSPRKEVKQG